MTTTYYASVTSDTGTMADPDHVGTSSTAADIIELRMGNGTYAPDRREVLRFLEQMRRWLMKGGLAEAGANVPLPTGPV